MVAPDGAISFPFPVEGSDLLDGMSYVVIPVGTEGGKMSPSDWAPPLPPCTYSGALCGRQIHLLPDGSVGPLLQHPWLPPAVL